LSEVKNLEAMRVALTSPALQGPVATTEHALPCGLGGCSS